MARGRQRIKINVGLQRQRSTPLSPSEPGYVAQMQQQSKMLTDALLDILDQFEGVSEDLMIQALEPTFEKAKMYTPKDTLELVESAYLEKTPFRGKPRVEMGFARGGSPDYAVYVHEIMSYQHEAPTRAKFLEQAMKEDLEHIYFRLGFLYREFMRGGGSGG